MDNEERKAIFIILFSTILGAALAFVAADATSSYSPIYTAVIAAYGIQWLAFIPAFILKTERFYDLVGSLTYTSIVLYAVVVRPHLDIRSSVIAIFIIVWALRLGSYLFLRVRRDREDKRFANVRQSFWRFLMAWTLQGLWVTFSLCAALAALLSEREILPDIFFWSGAFLWFAGFSIEIIADNQKRKFRKEKNNIDKFITTGMWAWSRHPNYFGEIVLWIGIAVLAFPVLEGWQLLTLISPVFIFLLLTKGSGIPLLEAAADKRWGDQTEYEKYKKSTSILIPLPPRKKL